MIEYKDPLHFDAVDRYLRRMEDKRFQTRRGSAESVIVLSPMSRMYRSTTITVLWFLCLAHR